MTDPCPKGYFESKFKLVDVYINASMSIFFIRALNFPVWFSI